MERRALISNIQKFCTYDGPGIRTVVFFMGCPLKCKWCQNPENLKAGPVMMFDREKCVSCGACISACENNAVKRNENGQIEFARSLCCGCGRCLEYCYHMAREICGSSRTVADVYQEVMKDEVFFRNTGGGITLSGGESTLYPNYVKELLEKIKEKGIHTAVETCGYCKEEHLKMIMDSVDLFLYDFKLYTNELHKKWTGQENKLIKQNLEYLVKHEKDIVIRIPLITGVNDGEEFEKILHYLGQYPSIKMIHIMPFHQLGQSKYELSDTSYEMSEWKECTMEAAAKCEKKALKKGFLINVGGWNL